ncbi:hypothetical protein ACMXYR_05270 [Neptuniibacter sp. QD29_5]|uniref:hypothetical protein n=1 Tax=unclassified Neptuniibacter TaxID=2630693 RepID=UPI0039F6BF72
MNRAKLTNLLFFSLTLSSIVEASPQTIWKDKSNYIAISSKADVNNDHPSQIEPEKLARILSQLRISDKTSASLLNLMDSSTDQHSRVFSNKEIDLLAQGLSKALTKAATNEAVTFSVSDFKSVYFGNKNLSVSGTAFIKDNNLNMIFGEIHVDLHKKYVRSGEGVSNSRFASNVELANFKLDTGNTSKVGQHDWQLQPFSGAELVNQRHDWVRISLDQNYDYIQEVAHKDQLEQKYLSNEQKAQESQQQNALEERIKKLEQATIQPAVTNTVKPSSVEARLRQLQELYEQGTIPESIYLEKMRSIISEL